jgi:hypothetical protein
MTTIGAASTSESTAEREEGGVNTRAAGTVNARVHGESTCRRSRTASRAFIFARVCNMFGRLIPTDRRACTAVPRELTRAPRVNTVLVALTAAPRRGGARRRWPPPGFHRVRVHAGLVRISTAEAKFQSAPTPKTGLNRVDTTFTLDSMMQSTETSITQTTMQHPPIDCIYNTKSMPPLLQRQVDANVVKFVSRPRRLEAPRRNTSYIINNDANDAQTCASCQIDTQQHYGRDRTASESISINMQLCAINWLADSNCRSYTRYSFALENGAL